MLFLCILYNEPRKKSFFECEKMAATNIEKFKQAILSDKPVLLQDAKSLYFHSEIETLLLVNYNLDKKFIYSPIFIVLQQNKDIFYHLWHNYKLFVAHKYIGFESKYYQASYAFVIINENESISCNNILFPLIMERICIEKTEVNGKPLLEILGLTSEGKFTNKNAEVQFLNAIKKLQTK